MVVMAWWTFLGLVSVAVFWIGMAAYCGYHLGRAHAFHEVAQDFGERS